MSRNSARVASEMAAGESVRERVTPAYARCGDWTRVRFLVLAVLLFVGTPAKAEEPAKSAGGDHSTSRQAKATPKLLYVNSYNTWVYAEPRLTPNGLGYFRAGAVIELRSGEGKRGAGCAGLWYAVRPMGYVCADHRTSFTPTRYTRSMAQALAKLQALPFEYALSNHAPMYRRLPQPSEWKEAERWLGKPGSFGKLSWGNRGHERLAQVRRIRARQKTPDFFADGGSVSRRTVKDPLRRMIPLGSMLAYTKSFEHAGRTWLFSADGTIVPADRVRPFRESQFSGVHLKGAEHLPLAWIRTESRPAFVREGDRFVEAQQAFAVRTHVGLVGGREPVERGRERYLETVRQDARGRSLFLREKDATVVEQVEKLPWGIGKDEKWIVFSITQGVLVAYRGLVPVFTTLASPGAGGVPVEGHDPVKWSTTPLGRFRVTFKHLAADMSSEKGEDRKFWIADVPYTQYFDPPFAIHVAYWHEDFGDPMSAGCVNVSPRDGKWLFGWTDPELPKGWNGIGPSKLTGKGTVVIIRR